MTPPASSDKTVESASAIARNIGIVGTGYLGRLHARVLTEIPAANVVGFVEPNDTVAAEVAGTLKLRRFDSV
ncbi:MAG: Gfo/Idh/MocA family oxidoreductase, partial [Acidobacteriota bacterium]